MAGHAFEQADLSIDRRFETMNLETRITINGQTGRIKVLAANPRTARGFSGDLILDEFAYHEDAAAIWEAAEPILSANKDYLCRIASTPNGKHNMFYRLCTMGSPALGSPSSCLASSSHRGSPAPRHDEAPINSFPNCGSRGDEALTNSPPTALEINPSTPTPTQSPTNLIPISIVTRTDAWLQGCPVFHPITREPITPDQARALAQNKRAYDQNYDCQFEDQNMALLTHELISAAERPNIAHICEQLWTPEAISFLRGSRGDEALTNSAPYISNQPFTSNQSHNHQIPISQSQISNLKSQIPSSTLFPSFSSVKNPQSAIPDPQSELPIPQSLFAGIDVARHHDQTVITVLERLGSSYIIRVILRLRDMRLPDQQQQLETILQLPNLKHAKIDMTGLGLGLFEYTHQKFPAKISGVNFSSSVSTQSSVLSPQSFSPTFNSPNSSSIRITEHLATKLLQTFEDRALQIPIDQYLRDDLRKPERLVSPSGRVSIAAARDASGHADHFWSLALALDAAQTPVRPPPASAPVFVRGRMFGRAPRRHKLYRE